MHKRLLLLVDNNTNALLMLNNLSSGLLAHAVTLFETGRIPHERIQEFVGELKQGQNEGELRLKKKEEVFIMSEKEKQKLWLKNIMKDDVNQNEIDQNEFKEGYQNNSLHQIDDEQSILFANQLPKQESIGVNSDNNEIGDQYAIRAWGLAQAINEIQSKGGEVDVYKIETLAQFSEDECWSFLTSNYSAAIICTPSDSAAIPPSSLYPNYNWHQLRLDMKDNMNYNKDHNNDIEKGNEIDRSKLFYISPDLLSSDNKQQTTFDNSLQFSNKVFPIVGYNTTYTSPSSPWLRLYLSQLAGCGLPMCYYPAGSVLRSIPRVFSGEEGQLLLFAEGREGKWLDLSVILPVVNEILTQIPCLIVGGFCDMAIPVEIEDNDDEDKQDKQVEEGKTNLIFTELQTSDFNGTNNQTNDPLNSKDIESKTKPENKNSIISNEALFFTGVSKSFFHNPSSSGRGDASSLCYPVFLPIQSGSQHPLVPYTAVESAQRIIQRSKGLQNLCGILWMCFFRGQFVPESLSLGISVENPLYARMTLDRIDLQSFSSEQLDLRNINNESSDNNEQISITPQLLINGSVELNSDLNLFINQWGGISPSNISHSFYPFASELLLDNQAKKIWSECKDGHEYITYSKDAIDKVASDAEGLIQLNQAMNSALNSDSNQTYHHQIEGNLDNSQLEKKNDDQFNKQKQFVAEEIDHEKQKQIEQMHAKNQGKKPQEVKKKDDKPEEKKKDEKTKDKGKKKQGAEEDPSNQPHHNKVDLKDQ
ncbi:MAG: hypothetical protein EZS28_013736 [Streblomastix strix]|uniref:FAM91 C-terminal domain-containing protein n=1 Tax=Streblomastix strix TaxID=222440 RepID=A0A5J4W7T9_9EUKA|nr:MAG: hypothetical protein EZS28_013736 [Streblomastix strix]